MEDQTPDPRRFTEPSSPPPSDRGDGRTKPERIRPLDTRRSQPMRRTVTRTAAGSMMVNWPAKTTAGGGWMGRGRRCKKWSLGCRWIEQAESAGGVWHDRRFFTKTAGRVRNGCAGCSVGRGQAAEGTARRYVQVETAGRGTRKMFAVATVVW